MARMSVKWSVVAAGLSVWFGGAAAQAETLAYARISNPTSPGYTVPASEAFNDGAPVRVSRSGTGRYQVSFGRVADSGANVQVSMIGTQPGLCSVASWSGGNANITCFGPDGRPADRSFNVLAIQAGPGDAANLAYAWLNQAGPGVTYQTQAAYTFAPTPIQVRSTRAGSYNVGLGDMVPARSTILASGYGGSADCSPQARVQRNLILACRDATGLAQASRASLLAIRAGMGGMSFMSYGRSSVDTAHSWTSSGTAPSVRQLDRGVYDVQLGPEASADGIVLADATFSEAQCTPESWGSGRVRVVCRRGTETVDSPFTVAAFRAGGEVRRMTLARSAWSTLLRTAASGLSVRINNFDRTNSQPLDCGPPCPPANRALIRNDSTIDYTPRIPGAGEPFTRRFTPQSVWRDPYLFLLNDINLLSRRIDAAPSGNRIVLSLPFESSGREVATACHEDARCGWGPADGNNKPNAEVDDLVIHIPFRLSVDRSRGAAPIRVHLEPVTYDADIRRAGTCHDNALAFLCDMFGGDIEGQMHDGLRDALNNFVATSGEVISRLEAGVNASLCSLAAGRGLDCAQLTGIVIERNGDITMIF